MRARGQKTREGAASAVRHGHDHRNRGQTSETQELFDADKRPGEKCGLGQDDPFAGFGDGDLMRRFEAENAAFARQYGIDPAGEMFRDHVVDALKRPNIAQWHDLDESEQRSVREYVLQETGVDPMPRHRPRAARARTNAPALGSTPALAASLLDQRFWSGMRTELVGGLRRAKSAMREWF